MQLRAALQLKSLFPCLIILSCSNPPQDTLQNTADQFIVIQEDVIDDTTIQLGPDIDVCSTDIPKSDLTWCTCNPECCKTQQWFCQPKIGDPSFYKKEVIVNICNDDLVPCDGSDDGICLPPEILYEGECLEAYECPPNSQSVDYGMQPCTMPDGLEGTQKVTCDKGKLYKSPCQACIDEICDGLDNDCDDEVDEGLLPQACQTSCGPGTALCVEGQVVCYGPDPEEEVCDYKDNDCDGEIDEDQKNICGLCGPVPEESCNNFDDDCDDLVDEDLTQLCTTNCGTGIEICLGGSWIGCTAQQPETEICDGLDNDCDGEIDEDLECVCSIQDVGKLIPCSESPLICGQGFKTCECLDDECLEIVTTPCFAGCYWLTDPPGTMSNCDSLIGMSLEEEICNAFDDNCNMLIDEDLQSGCYTGPAGTLGIGICSEGTITCDMGVWGSYNNETFVPGLCIDEQTPIDEICNGMDDNCDGEVDWGEPVPDTDILFVIDWSASMKVEIDAVLAALNQFAQNYNLEEKIHWGLIIGPYRDATIWDADERLLMVSDIADINSFLSSFSSLGAFGMGGSNEMLLDALYMAYSNISNSAGIDVTLLNWIFGVSDSIPPKDQFEISWRPGADRILIVFSDEVEQSYLSPGLLSSDIISACQGTPSSKLYAFSNNTSWGWDEMAAECGGKYFSLTMSITQTNEQLMEILDDICLGDN